MMEFYAGTPYFSVSLENQCWRGIFAKQLFPDGDADRLRTVCLNSQNVHY